jgi:hypothetical protein
VLSVDEAVEGLRQRCYKNWVAWAIGRGNWPIRITLGAPRGAVFDQDVAAAQVWAGSWAAAGQVPGTVRTEPRRAMRLGSHELPTAWEVDSPEQALQVDPALASRYQQARARFAAAAEMPEVVWGEIEQIPLKWAKVIAELDDRQWAHIVAVLTQLARGAGDARVLRQITIPGVHSKFIEQNAGLLAEMLGVTADPALDVLSRLKVYLGLESEQSPIHVHLACPHLRRQAGGLDRFSATAASINGSSLNPAFVLIIENFNFGTVFTAELSDAVVLYGLGYAATTLADLKWVRAADRVLYWGDIDRAGLAILASLRRAGIDAVAIAMDFATFDRCGELRHETRKSQLLDDATVPEGLALAEAELYARLNEHHRQTGRDLQLEQEHVPLPAVLAAIRRVCEESR